MTYTWDNAKHDWNGPDSDDEYVIMRDYYVMEPSDVIDALNQFDDLKLQVARNSQVDVLIQARARIAELETERDQWKARARLLNDADMKRAEQEVGNMVLIDRITELEAELDAVRRALNGYDDSDVASLAETLVAQRRELATAFLARWHDVPGPDPLEYIEKLASSILEEADDDQG